jgi:Spx/MgsR family transcriptional regulator
VINIYGLKNCDGCRKAINWLNSNNIEYKFFNLKDNTLSKILISEWIEVHSLEKIINKKSTTWRNLNEASKNQLDTEAVNIIINFPSLMKRPIWELNTKPHKELDPGFQDRHQNFIKKLV